MFFFSNLVNIIPLPMLSFLFTIPDFSLSTKLTHRSHRRKPVIFGGFSTRIRVYTKDSVSNQFFLCKFSKILPYFNLYVTFIFSE